MKTMALLIECTHSQTYLAQARLSLPAAWETETY